VTAETSPKGIRPHTRRFYAEALDEAERLLLSEAQDIEGVGEEIALLRLRLRGLIAQWPADLPLMLRFVEVLGRTVAAQNRLGKDDKASFESAVAALRDDVRLLWAEEPAEAVDEA
jgi:hypothetical protein